MALLVSPWCLAEDRTGKGRREIHENPQGVLGGRRQLGALLNTTIVAILCSGGTFLAKAIIDLCVERYKKAQEIKEARDDLEAELRTQAFLWREHAYAVRVAAVKAGVKVEDLPSVPKED